MVQLVRLWRKNPGIRQFAASIVQGLPQGDASAEVRALHVFVRDKIRYTNDIRNVETLQTPQATLEMGVGDCDDKTILLASLLESIGRTTRIVAVALGGGPYSHVVPEVKLGTKWYMLETIKPVEAGWSPNGITKRMTAHV